MTATKKPYLIVLGNEKGGTGKSTAAMHIVVSLLKMGFKVGTIDVDARQGTFSRYIENRKTTSDTKNLAMLMPQHRAIMRSTLENQTEAQADETERLTKTIEDLGASCDFIVIDTPGSDTYLSRLAHSFADTLITPLNDSFIDLDMLVRLKGEDLGILRPSTYAEMVWDQKKTKMARNNGTMDWIVMRNRLSSINAKNKAQMEQVLSLLAKRIGFRLADGFGERVIFRELFLSGMTLLDMDQQDSGFSLSHVSARQELRQLIQMIQLPDATKIPF